MIRVFSQYISPKSIALVILEGALMALALVCGARLRFWDNTSGFSSYVAFPDFALQTLAFVGILQICFYYHDLYDLSVLRRRDEQLISLAESLGIGCLILGLLYFVLPSLVIGRGVFFIGVFLAWGFLTLSRGALDRMWQVAAPRENILILGSDDLALTVAKELSERGDLNVRLAGFVKLASTNGHCPGTLLGRPVLGSTERLQAIVREQSVSRIVVAVEDRRNSLPIEDLVRLRVSGIRVEEAHSIVSALTGRVWLESVKPSWFVFTGGFQRSGTTLVLKRMIDLSCGLLGLALSLPIMMLVAIAVRLDSKGPILYRQTRVGLGGKCFELMKFRSMRVDAEAANGACWAAENDPRVTRIGRFLRRYRLDELPQFINVIRGEMSFVGPRPERPFFVDQLRMHHSYYDERHSVRPGLTGWAQVRYQYGSSVDDAIRKLEYDLFYLKNMSITFDLSIIFRTVRIVLGGHGGR